ncbi:MAG: hypothetical protein LH613_13135 [Chamaesiphon sp.]|nr:hypothetical protein [Chamaesiphon sp.]
MVNYSIDRFTPETIDRLLVNYRSMLTGKRGASPPIHRWGRACRGFSRLETIPRL